MLIDLCNFITQNYNDEYIKLFDLNLNERIK